MARFVFKLETVLKQRKRLEQEKQRELAVRHAKQVALEDQLKRMDESVKQASEDLRRDHLTGSIDLSFLTAHRRFLTSMQRQGMQLVQQIAAAKAHVEDARRQLAEAAKRRKAIDRLRERAFEAWREDLARHEMAELDEIGTQIAYADLQERNDS